jgi:hypothetical protein
MSTPERIFEQAAELLRRVSSEARQRSERGRKRRRRLLARMVKTAALMALSTFVIVVGMISGGFLFGPRGVEGLIAAPFAIVVAWTAILYWSLRSRPTPRVLVKSDLAQLPARTEEWLDAQRWTLPAAAQQRLDSIALRLEALAPQVQALDPQTPAAAEVRRLIGEELPELVRGYQKLPRALQSQPLHGGHSPDRRLVEGLATIDEQIERVHLRLAADDLHALATQQRYLEIKYKGDKLE